MTLIEDGVCVRVPGRDYGDGPQLGRLDEVTAGSADGKADGVPLAQLGLTGVVDRGVR